MYFDPENKVVQLCAQGMEMEGNGASPEAAKFFYEAWKVSENGFEKFTAAHYVARVQKSVTDKLHWDNLSLHHALMIDSEEVKSTLPSLHLNVGNCFENLGDFLNAKSHYNKALANCVFLPADGYGEMIRSGIQKGLERISCKVS